MVFDLQITYMIKHSISISLSAIYGKFLVKIFLGRPQTKKTVLLSGYLRDLRNMRFPQFSIYNLFLYFLLIK